jgi:hypothetical protein
MLDGRSYSLVLSGVTVKVGKVDDVIAQPQFITFQICKPD